MKRALLLHGGIFVLVLVVVWTLGGGFAGAIDAAPSRTPATPQSIERGAYLARAGNCVTCHTQRGGVAYAGGRPLATPFGTVYTSNLTPDAETGLGKWSAEAFWRAMHHGLSRDGRLLYPAFPYDYYTQVTRADSDALYDYLRSLQPVRAANRAHELDWPYNTQAALAMWRTLFFRAGEETPGSRGTSDARVAPAAPAPRDASAAGNAGIERGRYLVTGLGHCGACHSARNVLGATRDLLDLSGGVIPMQNWYAPSLSSPHEAGVADWPVEDIVRLLQTGASPRGTVLGPMAEVVLNSTQYLTREDIGAMALFLKSLPPASPPASRPAAPEASAERMRAGARLYENHCVQCHGARGEGVANAYPPLAGNRAALLPVTANLVQVVLFGGYAPATQGNPRPFGMPPFAMVMSDADVASLLTYVRGSWGNKAAPVSELEVTRQRSSTK